MLKIKILCILILLGGTLASAQSAMEVVRIPNDNIQINTENLEKLKNRISQPDSILNIYVKDAGYQWISYQMKVNLKTHDQELAFQCFFVNRIDSLIYLNLHKSGIELARLVLTPDSLIYVNKLNKEYYRGDYGFLNAVFGLPLDFQMIQALLNACDFPHFDAIRYQMEADGNWRYISPLRMRQDQTCSLMQEIDIQPFTQHIVKNDITDLKSLHDVVIRYDDYAPVEEGDSSYMSFNKLIVEIGDENVLLQADLKNIRLDIPGPTSIKIPDTFSEIELK